MSTSPSAASSQQPTSAHGRPGDRARKTTSVDIAQPSIRANPPYTSQRPMTPVSSSPSRASSSTGADATSCSGTSPTMNENAPDVTWPSTADRACQLTVYTPSSSGGRPSRTMDASSVFRVSSPTSTGSPEASNTLTWDRSGSGGSLNSSTTSAGASSSRA